MGESLLGRNWNESREIGLAAFRGRVLGTLAKMLVGSVMVAVAAGAILIRVLERPEALPKLRAEDASPTGRAEPGADMPASGRAVRRSWNRKLYAPPGSGTQNGTGGDCPPPTAGWAHWERAPIPAANSFPIRAPTGRTAHGSLDASAAARTKVKRDD